MWIAYDARHGGVGEAVSSERGQRTPGKYSTADLLDSGKAGPEPPVPGRRSHAELLGYEEAPVQRKATAETGLSGVHAQRVAREGVVGATDTLHHADLVQRFFGRHDVSNIRAQVGGSARAATQTLGATAYAQGDRVAFADAPDLHTAAHEAAHVVQQRHGHQPAGGMDSPGDALEQHADRVADAVVAGQSAEALLDSIASGGAHESAQAVQRKAAEQAPTSQQIRGRLQMYLNGNSGRVLATVGEHMLAASFPTPHPRLTWVDHQGFVVKMLKQLETALSEFSPLTHLDELLFPTTAAKALGGLLPQTDEWSIEMGMAVAHALHVAVVSSIKRLAPRYLEVADSQRKSGENAVRWTDLVASMPMDRYIAVALCWSNVVSIEPLAADSAKQARGKRVGIRKVTKLTYEGERDPALWNWVRVHDPADATAEDVAEALWSVDGDHGDRTASYKAYLLAAAPPLFGVPKRLAKDEPRMARHAPPRAQADQEHDSVEAQLLTIASSGAVDDVAHERAPVAAGVASGLPADVGRTTEAIKDCTDQLAFIASQLAPWGLAGQVIGAKLYLTRKAAELPRLDPAVISDVTATVEGQKNRLSRIGGGVNAVSDSVGKLGAQNPDDPQAAPIREILQMFAAAAGLSHVRAASENLLLQALQLQSSLSARALQATERNMMTELAGAHQTVSDKHMSDVSSEAVQLQDDSRRLQSQMLNGEEIDADELEDVSVKSEELALESRLYSTLTAIAKLNEAASAAGKGDAAIIASLFSGRFRGLPAVSKHLFEEIRPIRSGLWSSRKAFEEEVKLGGATKERRTQQREARRKSLTEAQTRFENLSKQRDLQEWFENARASIENQQFRTACVKVAAMIGLSIAAGMVSGLAARAVGGMLVEAGGAASVSELGYVAKAGIEATRIGVETTLSSAGTSAIQGTSFSETWKENLITSLTATALFGTYSRIVAREAQAEGRIAQTWKQVGKLGKAKMVAKEVGAVSFHTVWNVVIGDVSSRLVTGKAQPSPATLREWAMQSLSVAIGRHVSERIMTHSETFKALGDQAEGAGRRLVKSARKLQQLAKRVISTKQPDLAMQLLAEHDQFLREQVEALDRAISKRGDPTGTLSSARASLEAAANVAGLEGMTETKMVLAGMEELIPGALWKGSREQIDRAVAQTSHEKQPLEVVSHDAEGKRWRLKVGERVIEVQETISGARSVHEDRVVLAGSDEGMRVAAKLVAPEPGRLDVVVHGSVDGFLVVRDGVEIHLEPRQVAEYIKKQGLEFKRIRLIACRSGVHPKGAAQHLANKLGVPVEAPSDTVYIHPDGTLTIGPSENRNTGHWIEYKPQPSESRYQKAPAAEHAPAAPGRAKRMGGGENDEQGKVSAATGAQPSRDTVKEPIAEPAKAANGEQPALRPPSSRHYLAKITQGTLAKETNTVIEPRVDVAADVGDIRAGRAVRKGNAFEVNGRVYGIHDGTLYPISGDGFHQLNRGAFQALGVFIKFGDGPRTLEILANMKNVGPGEIEAARTTWKLRP